uniref:Restriction endonuclease n=2 Tax=root TaxID=1 RepID=A0A481YXX3_9VIRU|nr:MAG: restriction endonuclease [Marseillevirus LCMAC202]
MPKLTWKEATLNHIKAFLASNDNPVETSNLNIFRVKQLTTTRLEQIVLDTRSRSKNPGWTLDNTLRELRNLKIVRYVDPGVYEFIPNSDNEELIYKDKRSIGHIRITKCLDRLSIKYEEEKTFHDLKHISFLRFDIYFVLLERKLAIEYDGIQHQKAVDIWGGEECLENGQNRDLVKNAYCTRNGITLLRVSHDIKDIEQYVIDFVCRIVREQLTSCVLTVFIYLYLYRFRLLFTKVGQKTTPAR